MEVLLKEVKLRFPFFLSLQKQLLHRVEFSLKSLVGGTLLLSLPLRDDLRNTHDILVILLQFKLNFSKKSAEFRFNLDHFFLEQSAKVLTCLGDHWDGLLVLGLNC